MELKFYAKHVEVSNNSSIFMDVLATDVNVEDVAKDVIEEIDAETIVELFNNNEALLDEIGIDYVKAYFDLKEY